MTKQISSQHIFQLPLQLLNFWAFSSPYEDSFLSPWAKAEFGASPGAHRTQLDLMGSTVWSYSWKKQIRGFLLLTLNHCSLSCCLKQDVGFDMAIYLINLIAVINMSSGNIKMDQAAAKLPRSFVTFIFHVLFEKSQWNNEVEHCTFATHHKQRKLRRKICYKTNHFSNGKHKSSVY